MAAANLTISDGLKACFEASCGAGDVRCVRAEIKGEAIVLCADPTLPVAGDAAADFATLGAEKVAPRFYLYNTDPAESGGWVLVAYVEETCRVRDKMLYASSHKHLMGALGASFFKGEFYCNDAADFVYEGVLDSCRSGLVGAPLTEAEEARAAEQKATIGQDIEQAGMSALPFQLTGQALEKLAELNTGAINFVELKVDAAEQVDLVSAKSLASPDEISGSIDPNNGRFYALRFEDKLFFVLSCPDATPIKDRMILATVKATVLEACTQAGLSFTKMVEVQDPADVTSDLAAEISALTEDRSVKNDLAFSKPKGPPRRRGKRRMMKK